PTDPAPGRPGRGRAGQGAGVARASGRRPAQRAPPGACARSAPDRPAAPAPAAAIRGGRSVSHPARPVIQVGFKTRPGRSTSVAGPADSDEDNTAVGTIARDFGVAPALMRYNISSRSPILKSSHADPGHGGHP